MWDASELRPCCNVLLHVGNIGWYCAKNYSNAGHTQVFVGYRDAQVAFGDPAAPHRPHVQECNIKEQVAKLVCVFLGLPTVVVAVWSVIASTQVSACAGVPYHTSPCQPRVRTPGRVTPHPGAASAHQQPTAADNSQSLKGARWRLIKTILMYGVRVETGVHLFAHEVCLKRIAGCKRCSTDTMADNPACVVTFGCRQVKGVRATIGLTGWMPLIASKCWG